MGCDEYPANLPITSSALLQRHCLLVERNPRQIPPNYNSERYNNTKTPSGKYIECIFADAYHYNI